MISEELHDLCTDGDSVSYLLATNSKLSPGEAWNSLYGHRHASIHVDTTEEEIQIADDAVKHNDTQRAQECGHWGSTKPSDLFLQVSRFWQGENVN
jgi:hypothetical protein